MGTPELQESRPQAGGGGPPFDGAAYVPEHDQARLRGQHERIRDLMLDGRWRTLSEISAATGDPEASISAQLRHLRKKRFGGWLVDRRTRGDRSAGLFEFRVRSAHQLVLEPVDHTRKRPTVTQRLQQRVQVLETENRKLRAQLAGQGAP